ncbi:MAG: PAC2 family protein, partial [Methanocalculaceae archaeon]|nr:PAC2 family protein [Methanocalculaceae archaeon]
MEQVNVHWYVDNVSAHSAEIAIAGLPGVGYVGKLVVDHLIRSLSAMKIAEITSTLFPPQMYLNEDAVLHLPCNEIFFVPGINKQTSVIFLAGDYQSTSSEGHYTLAEEYLRVFDLLGVRRIYTLGGYSIGRMVEHPRVISAISSSFLREEVLAVGAVIIPEGP